MAISYGKGKKRNPVYVQTGAKRKVSDAKNILQRVLLQDKKDKKQLTVDGSALCPEALPDIEKHGVTAGLFRSGSSTPFPKSTFDDPDWYWKETYAGTEIAVSKWTLSWESLKDMPEEIVKAVEALLKKSK